MNLLRAVSLSSRVIRASSGWQRCVNRHLVGPLPPTRRDFVSVHVRGMQMWPSEDRRVSLDWWMRLFVVELLRKRGVMTLSSQSGGPFWAPILVVSKKRRGRGAWRGRCFLWYHVEHCSGVFLFLVRFSRLVFLVTLKDPSLGAPASTQLSMFCGVPPSVVLHWETPTMCTFVSERDCNLPVVFPYTILVQSRTDGPLALSPLCFIQNPEWGPI